MLDKLLEEGYIRKIKTKEGMVDESLPLLLILILFIALIRVPHTK